MAGERLSGYKCAYQVLTALAICLLLFLLKYDVRFLMVKSIDEPVPVAVDEKENSRQVPVIKANIRMKQLGLGNGHVLLEQSLKHIRIDNASECVHRKFLVYTCDYTWSCGGWGDREKGIVSSFLLALLTNRTFVINATKPCGIQQFLHPNVYNWNVCGPYLKSVRGDNIMEFRYINTNNSKLDQIKDFNFDSKWNKQVIIMRSNSHMIHLIKMHRRTKTQIKWLLKTHVHEVIHLILHTLFVPNKQLFENIMKFHMNHTQGKHLVCAHIRMRQNPTIPLDIPFPKGSPNQTVIFDFLQRYDNINSTATYIATDSDEVKKQAKTMFDSYVNLNRPIVHVEKFGKQQNSDIRACEGFNTVLMEQFILSQCDTLVLTESGFGYMAAYIRGVSDNLFVYSKETNNVLKINIKFWK